MTLVDTSVLVRCQDATSPTRLDAAEFIDQAIDSKTELCLVPQVVVEFLAVATRPTTSNGLGRERRDAFAALDTLTSAFTFLGDHALLFEVWRSLVERHEVRGKSVHDARLVAAMRVHSISRIATFNAADFRRYADIEIVVPGDPS